MKIYIILTFITAITVASAKEMPHVIFFMADDMGLGDIQVYDNNSTIPTPNMDLLASQGIRFTDAHSPASVCTPTRYGVLNGMYPFRSALQDSVLRSAYDLPLLNNEFETVASLMKRAGYRTAAFGKWHLGMTFTGKTGEPAEAGIGTSKFSTRDVNFSKPILNGPINHGFNYFFGLGSSINHGPYTFIENSNVTEIPTQFREQKDIEGSNSFREGWIAPGWDDSQQGTVVCNKALSFIRNHIREMPDQPFFIYYAATANHWPHVPPEKLNGKPIRHRGGMDDSKPLHNDMVVENDIILGEMMSLLDELSIAEDTLIIFTSDNGADIGYYDPIRGKKGSIYEGGHRVPFIARWPKQIPSARISNHPISLVDLYATLAALTNTSAKPYAARDSQNVLPALLDKVDRSWSRGPLLQQAKQFYALRQDNWKLIIQNDKPKELYDLDKDLKESHNCLSEHPLVAKQLFAQYKNIKTAK